MLSLLLKEIDLFETDAEAQERTHAISQLNKSIQSWAPGSRVFTFGLYSLGVRHPGISSDVLCVTPKTATHDSFLDELPNVLRDTNLFLAIVPLFDASTPLIKGTFLNGLKFNLVMARSLLDVVPLSLTDLVTCEETTETIFALRSYRMSATIKDCVPNADAFSTVLRAVRLWAEKRNIYSAVFGYLHSTSLTVMVARVCQEFPDADEVALLLKFFILYDIWPWPAPVTLKDADNKIDVRHSRTGVAPVLCPVRPVFDLNSSVSSSTLRVLKQEFARCILIRNEMKKHDDDKTKKELLKNMISEESDFFSRYKHYISIIAASSPSSSTSLDHGRWVDWIHSHLGHFVSALNDRDVDPHLFPQSFQTNSPKNPRATRFFIGLDIKTIDEVDLKTEVNWFNRMIAKYAGMKKSMTMSIRGLLQTNIPRRVLKPPTQCKNGKRKREEEEETVPCGTRVC